MPAGRLVDRATNAAIPDEALRTAFGPALDEDRIVTYCGVGIAAAADALALVRLGHTNVAVYDGSLAEWSTLEHLPVASLV